MEESKPSELQPGSVDSTSIATSERAPSRRPSAIAASLPRNRKTTLRGRSFTCVRNSRTPKLSKTLEAGSTSSAKDCSPYWSGFHAAPSSRLWLPTETVLRDLDSNSSSIWSSKTVEKSWFSTKLITAPNASWSTIFSPSSLSSHVAFKDSEDIIRKSKKIRVYPSKTVRAIFKQWVGVSRRAYNDTVAYLRRPATKANWKSIKGELLAALPEWADSTPYQIKSIAVKDACKAVGRAKMKWKTTGQPQRVHFRTRKDSVQSFYIPKMAVFQRGLYPTLSLIEKGEFEWAEELPEEHGDCRLVCDGHRWYVCVPVQEQRRPSEIQGRVVSIDPGIRTFATFFSESSCGKIGHGDFGRIQRMCSHLDALISNTKREDRSLRRRRLRLACARMRARIRDLVDELHHKVALFFVKNFDIILLPTFETKDMVSRARRRIGRKSVRSMLTFSHYRFKSFLKHKAFEHGKLVIDTNEAWTSKTVSWTGETVDRLGGAKKIRSLKTGDVMDRDYNGARGIFLRALGDEPFLKESLQNALAPAPHHGDLS